MDWILGPFSSSRRGIPKVHEVGADLLGDVDASFSSPEPE